MRENFTSIRRRLRENGPGMFAFKALRYPFKPLLVPGAVAALKARSAEVASIDDAIQIVRTFNHRGITVSAWQIDSELRQLLQRLEAEPPKTVLDIGTANGGLLYLFTRLAADDAVLVSVDLEHGRFGGGYPRWRSPLYRSFARAEQRLELVRGDSHRPETFERIRTLLGGREVDFLFVDGDHTYQGVAADFATYSPLVREGGMIGFHDITPAGDPELVGGVPTFWQELKTDHEVEEFVDDWGQDSCGIGFLRKPARGSAAPPPATSPAA